MVVGDENEAKKREEKLMAAAIIIAVGMYGNTSPTALSGQDSRALVVLQTTWWVLLAMSTLSMLGLG